MSLIFATTKWIANTRLKRWPGHGGPTEINQKNEENTMGRAYVYKPIRRGDEAGSPRRRLKPDRGARA